MNRKLQLKYCSVCLNRKFDPNRGIICKLTDSAAEFLDSCEQYQVDEDKLKEQKATELKALSDQELITSLPEEIKDHLRQHQSIGFAVLGGVLAAIFSAILWAVISVAAQYQIGWMAIGVGLLVGFSVRFFGAGIDEKFGYLGAGLAVFACLLGNLLSQVGFYATEEATPYLEVLGYLTPIISLEILMESFVPIDLLFFGIAGYQGYKFAFRSIPVTLENDRNYSPPMAKLRLPLAGVSAVLIGICLFMVSSSSEAERTNYYDSGKIFSKGKLVHGFAEGEWEYYYEDGGLGGKGNYSNGMEEGIWEYYDESGILTSLQEYHRGLLHGNYTDFHGENLVYQQGEYKYGRMSGEWTTFYEDKSILSKGNYQLDLPEGEWEYYHQNGNISQKGNFVNGEKEGIWKTWDEDGQLLEETNHISEDEVEWISYKEKEGDPSVQNGNGDFASYHLNGKIAVSGPVKNKKMDGIWSYYDENGNVRSTIHYKDNKGKTVSIRDKNGKILIENGSGKFTSYYDSGSLQQEGEYADGMKQGKWVTYFEEDGSPNEIANYVDDLLDGTYVTYHSNGQEEAKGGFQAGKRHGLWAWYSMDGNIESEVRFVDGKKSGEQIFYNEFESILKKEIYENGNLVETILP